MLNHKVRLPRNPLGASGLLRLYLTSATLLALAAAQPDTALSKFMRQDWLSRGTARRRRSRGMVHSCPRPRAHFSARSWCRSASEVVGAPMRQFTTTVPPQIISGQLVVQSAETRLREKSGRPTEQRVKPACQKLCNAAWEWPHTRRAVSFSPKADLKLQKPGFACSSANTGTARTGFRMLLSGN